jgi:hypothetical protein
MTDKFQSYVCIGDSVEWTTGGFDLKATIRHDHDTKPEHYECYSEEQITRWKNDEWFYCGLVVSVSFNGVPLTDHAASLWGIDCNLGEDNKYLDDVAKELEGEAIEEARIALMILREKLEVAA